MREDVQMGKKWWTVIGAVILLFLAAIVAWGSSGRMEANVPGKRAILLVSFGTSYADTRAKTIDAIAGKVKEAFPGWEVRQAFTSNIIIDILKKRDNIVIDTPEEALAKLDGEAFSEVIVQSTHIINGAEFHDLVITVNRFREGFDEIRIGLPLLSSTDDYRAVMDALEKQMPPLGEGEAVVLMGHGTSHPANAAYPALQFMMLQRALPMYLGTVEGYPELDDVITLLEENDIREVTLMPFMVVAGDHATNDMAGDGEDSWKSILTAMGYRVNVYLHGIGENEAIQDMYVDHVRKAIEGHEEEGH
jgi:sirohydrochlorin cobaltochelatase